MENIPNFTEEQCDELEQRANAALDATNRFEGTTESAENLLFPTLIRLEAWFLECIGERERALSNDVQRAVLQAIRRPGSIIATVNELFDRAVNQLGQGAQSDQTPSEIAQAFMGVSTKAVDQVLIPPDEESMPEEEGGDTGWQVPRFQPRLQTLIRELNRRKIYTNELILIDGKRDENQMRQVSYAIVEIPRIWRDVIVCNQIGEASRISKAPLGVEAYSRMTKKQLDAFPNSQSSLIVRVICRDVHEWVAEVLDILLREGQQDLTSRRKLDVQRVQDMRQSIENQMNAQQWVALTDEQIQCLQIGEESFENIFAIFGLDQDVSEGTSLQRRKLMVGAVVFGRANPSIQAALELLDEQEIQIAEGRRQREQQELAKRRQQEIEEAALLQHQEQRDSDERVQIEILRTQENRRMAALLERYPTAQEWFESYGYRDKTREEIAEEIYYRETVGYSFDRPLSQAERDFVDGLNWLGERLGFAEGFPGYVKWTTYIRMAGLIYGENDPVVAQKLEPLRASEREGRTFGDDIEKWKEAIRRQVPTLVEWAKVIDSTTFQYCFYAGGESWEELSLRFGVDLHSGPTEEPVRFYTPSGGGGFSIQGFNFEGSAMIKLGAAIFGVDADKVRKEYALVLRERAVNRLREKKEREREELRELAVNSVQVALTCLEWLNMDQDDRYSIRVGKMNLDQVAELFDKKISPLNSLRHHYELAKAFWPDDPAIDAALNGDNIDYSI